MQPCKIEFELLNALTLDDPAAVLPDITRRVRDAVSLQHINDSLRNLLYATGPTEEPCP